MTFGRRIHAAALGLAVGYLFIGSAVTRSAGVLEANVPKALLGVAGAWLAWVGTGTRKKEVREASAPARGEALPISRSLVQEPTRRPTVSPDRLKRRSELAFGNGWTVEAAYWLAIALLRGGTDRSGRMRNYVETWLESGRPDESGNVHAGFTAAQSSFGRAVLRFESGAGRALAIARLDQMAKAGDADARAYLEANGIGQGGET